MDKVIHDDGHHRITPISEVWWTVRVKGHGGSHLALCLCVNSLNIVTCWWVGSDAALRAADDDVCIDLHTDCM